MNRIILSITLLLSLAALAAGVIIGNNGIYTKPSLTADARQILINLNQQAYRYSFYNTTDFSDVMPPPWHDLCNYPDEQMKLAEQHKIEHPCVLWNDLREAKHHFRLMSLTARAIAPPNVLTALDNVENGFMEVFDVAVGVDEYNKWPQDEYGNIMQSKIENLESAIRGALK